MQGFIRKTLLTSALLGALAATGSAHAAFTLNDNTVDGGWADVAGGNRGADLDYIRTGVGKGVLFVAIYSYDAAGNPTWLTTSVEVDESQFKLANVPLYRFNGGNFSGAAGSPVRTQATTATITFETCNELKIDIAAGGNVPASTFTLQKGEALAGRAPQECVYTRKFASCPAGTTAVANVERTCLLSGTYNNNNLTLTNDTTWVLSGLVKIGTRNTSNATLTIEPGTRITGQGQTSDYLYVEPGSKIFAEGLSYAPIVFTSPKDAAGQTPAPKDWGGIVVSGNAPTNCTNNVCDSEFDPNLKFGGTNANESSGALRYVQVRYAGYVFAPNREVNAFTFQGVGSGTVTDYIQAYRGGDDGVEFFGGTNNVRHLVVTEGGDDAIDWDLGWNGKVQYALVQNGNGLGEDRGIEAANNPNAFDATPRATPILSNLTLLGNGRGSHGIELKQGSGGRIWNSIVSNFPTSCLFLTGTATYAAAGTPTALTGNTTLRNTILNCTSNFRQDDGAPFTAEAFFNAQPGNSTANANLTGFLPQAGSPALTIGGAVLAPGGTTPDAFFENVPYAGAFSGPNGNWTNGWTVGVNP